MSTTDLSAVARFPRKKCSSRFCDVEGPFINKQLWLNGPLEAVVLGRCDTCWQENGVQGRYVCTRCALRTPASPATEGWEVLICRYCGEPLGQGKEIYKMDTTTLSSLAEESLHAAASPNQLISPAIWWSLYQRGIVQGWLTTAGLRKALHITQEGTQRSVWLLSLLSEELARCRAASYRAGEARCFLETARILLSLGRPGEALGDLAQAEPLLRVIGNVTLLRDTLTLKALGQRAIGAEPQERVRVLDEALALYQQGVDSATLQSSQAYASLRKEKPIILLANNQLVQATDAMRQLPEGAKLMRQHAEQRHRQNRQEQRLPRHNPDVSWDEEALDRVRATHEVWGCPLGHQQAGTAGMVPLPRGQAGNRNTCAACGCHYILLNRYYHVTATVPDIFPPGLLEVADWNHATEDEGEQLNLALVFRDGGQVAAADQLQARVLSAWEHTLGSTTLDFATALNLLGRVLQERDEHHSALALFERAVSICESLGTSGEELLGHCLNNQGCSLLCLRHEQEAEAKLLKACQLRPQSPNPYYWLAKLCARRGAEAITREQKSWKTFLATGGTTPARRQEAKARLEAIAFQDEDGKRAAL